MQARPARYLGDRYLVEIWAPRFEALHAIPHEVGSRGDGVVNTHESGVLWFRKNIMLTETDALNDKTVGVVGTLTVLACRSPDWHGSACINVGSRLL